jgi:N-acetylneuraminic acid mutarotase
MITTTKPIAKIAMLTGLCIVTIAQPVHAHFIWLAPCTEGQSEPKPGEVPTSLQVFFGEDASPDDADYFDLLSGMKLWRLHGKSSPEPIEVTRDADSLSAKLSTSAGELAETLYVASHNLGVREKGEAPFLLVYHAKTGPGADAPAWRIAAAEELIALDVVPAVDGGMIELAASFNGSPAASCEAMVMGPGIETLKKETDADGKVSFDIKQAGRYAIRVRHVENKSGKVEDKAYESIRHYTTVTLDVPTSLLPIAADSAYSFPELPVTLTSFGGAVLADHAYIYGGTRGSAHDYYKGIQSGALMRLPVSATSKDQPVQWETISEGPELQGLAMVAHDGKLYRLGGFEARNAKGEDESLWSIDTVACFDPKTATWSDMPSLPEPRSSFDAAMLGSSIYVVGGWSMQGEARRVWHETAWKLDLSQADPQWQAIAKTPFERRALTIAAHDDKLYAIGGITSGDETVRETDVYDPQTDSWSKGPELVGDDGLTGFGASAFATGGKLYISTVKGSLQRLSDDGQSWSIVGQTPTARFFHRMLPIDNQRFVMIGGSNMTVGRIKATEVIAVP